MKKTQSYKNANLTESWDAIVIGSGIGGLTPAAFLAKEGQRVLVLEKHSTAGGCTQTYTRKGYEWDAGLHYVGEVHRLGGTMRKIFDHITDGRLEWAPMPEVYNRIVIGNRFYEHVAGIERFKKRMKEYFPSEQAAIDKYIDLVMEVTRAGKTFFAQQALPGEIDDELYTKMSGQFHTFSDRTALEVLREITDNDELIAVLCGNCGDYVSTPGRVSFAMQAMLTRHYLDGANFPIGGAGRIAETIGEVIGTAGGSILVDAEVASILVKDGKACGVSMKEGREFRAPVIISDAGLRNTILRLLPSDLGQVVGLLDQCRGMELSNTYAVLNIGIRESNKTLGLDPANLWVHPSPDIDGNVDAYEKDPMNTPMPIHFISVPSAKDPTWEDRFPDRTTIDVCSLTTWSIFEPFAGTQWKQRGREYEELKHKLSHEMLSQVLRFYPNLEGKIDYMELATPLSFNHFLGREQGEIMSLAHTPKRYQKRWLRAISPIPNLFLSGQDVTSGGIVGAIGGGVAAVSAVLGKNVVQDLK